MTETIERLPVRTKLMYGAGDFGFSLSDSIIAVLFAIFLTDIVGLDPALAAAAIFLGRSFDYINDPIIGHISDRTRSRWGRRRPFLLFGFIPFALTYTLLWWKPPIEAPIGLAIYYGLVYMLYDAAATFVYMPYFTLTPELTPDYDERTRLTSYRMAFSIVGGLIAYTVPLMLIGDTIPENAGKVLLMGAAFGAASALPLLLTFFGTRERPEYQNQKQPSLRQSLKAAAKNRPFIFAAGIFLFTWTALDIVQVMLLYFLEYRMGLNADDSGSVIGTIFIAALLTLPFWVWIVKKWDKRAAYIFGMVFLSAVMIVLIVIDPAWGMTVILSLAALAGIGVGAMHVLPWAIIPDAIELDELETGQRHEGVFYSLVMLLKKISSSIAIPLTLLVMKWTDFVPNAPEQSATAVRGIQTLMGPVPAVILLVGILFALMYPLSRARHAEVRRELARRKAELSDS